MSRWTQTATAKVLGIGLLALLTMVPLWLVQEIGNQRAAWREQAEAEISHGWGAAQTLGGPVLAVPTRRAATDSDGKHVLESTDIGLADTAQTTATLSVQKRHHGIYEVPVFVADIHIHERFAPEDLTEYRKEAGGSWLDDKAELRLFVSDLQGLQEVRRLNINGKPHRFISSVAQFDGHSVTAVPIDLRDYAGQAIEVDLELILAGTSSLKVLPLARQSHVDISAPWSDPSFDGAFLPRERHIDAHGFSATWQVMELNRNYGQHWDSADPTFNLEGQRTGTNDVEDRVPDSAFGVTLYQPASIYQMNQRTWNYGEMFIGLTFLAFFLFEVIKRLRIHPVQYLLIGAALVTFYALLLALSERIGFGWAYLAGALAVVIMVGGYAIAILNARAGLLLAGVIALLYAVLYGLIGAEDCALLWGAGLMLGVVALLMYLTRRVDWYVYGGAANHGKTGSEELSHEA